MLKLNSIKRDLALEDEGEWHEVPEWPGVRIKARSIDSKDYQIARQHLVTKLTRTLGRSPTGPEMEPMLGKIVARFLLRGWEGIVGEDEKTPLEWTPDVGIAYLSNPEFRDLETKVIIIASMVGDRDAEFVVDAAKNSGRPSVSI
jgi:hypothetical protein